MEATVALGVCYHTVAFFVVLTAVFHVIIGALSKVIRIDEIIASVVWRIGCRV